MALNGKIDISELYSDLKVKHQKLKDNNAMLSITNKNLMAENKKLLTRIKGHIEHIHNLEKNNSELKLKIGLQQSNKKMKDYAFMYGEEQRINVKLREQIRILKQKEKSNINA